MRNIHMFFEKLYDKKIDSIGLGLFRILFGTVMFFEVLRLFKFRHLIFDPIPFIELGEISIGIAIIIWLVSILFLTAGLYARICSIVNYTMSLTVVATMSTFEYHVFYTYVGVNFLFIFLPVSKAVSLDNIRLGFKNSIRKTSVASYYILVIVGVGVVYLDSIFYKFSSDLWLNGLGAWLPASLPQITHSHNQWLLNQQWFIIAFGYFTILFELIFVFVFFRKKWRVPILLMGLVLHIGILIEFPIPYFALTVIAVYILLIPVSFLRKKVELLSRVLPINKLAQVAEKFLTHKEIMVNVNDQYKYKKNQVRILTYGCLFLCLLQVNISLQSGILKNWLYEPVLEKVFEKTGLSVASDKLKSFSTIFLGITHHAVFMDNHFGGYNHVIALKYVENDKESVWLPIISEEMYPEDYIYGANWVNWTFRVNGPFVDNDQLTAGIKRYTSYWLHKTGRDTKNAKIEVLMKKIPYPTEWEKDYLTKQLNKEWITISRVEWKNDKFYSHLPKIEEL